MQHLNNLRHTIQLSISLYQKKSTQEFAEAVEVSPSTIEAIKDKLKIKTSKAQQVASLTKVNTTLSPGLNSSYDLGSNSLGWRGLYLSGYVYLGGKHFITNPGIENNFIGTNAGQFITTGHYNLAAGYNALYNDSTGSNNTATGAEAMYRNTTGSDNTGLGYFALNRNVSGEFNTATGSLALYQNTIGSHNTANGHLALSNNTSGSYNTADGVSAMYWTTGSYNTFSGANAGYFQTTGYYNTGVGYSALLGTTGAYYNTAVGYDAGYSQDNGYNNVFLGANTDVNGAGYYNVIAIGQGTVCTNVSQARIGNSATTSIGGYTNWSNISDGRVKKNIKQNVPGLAFINKLQPVTYNLDLDAADRIIQAPTTRDSAGKSIEKSAVEMTARKAKEQVIYSGFIAQDVEKIAKSVSYDFSGVDAAKMRKTYTACAMQSL